MKNTHKGSALLIVLGMLSFMVISAVAFAAYMRTARLPSSFLRRTVASRLLAKAALAEAMERLDYAIGDNPYPGVGTKISRNLRREQSMGLTNAEISNPHNYFYHHIFIGTNGWLEADETVSTLTLEGLAYLPPPLVNEARRYSRMTPTAKWHWLGFDAGRYAYSVVDVSDCFDVNRMMADLRRNSGANRVSMAYLFENADHSDYAVQPANWDTFMKQFLKQDSSEDALAQDPGLVDENTMPLVSMADFNLALASLGGSTGLKSPFCDYINKGRNDFYGLSSARGTEASKYRNMMFMTDSYFPVATNDDVAVDISKPEGQPFANMSGTQNASFYKVMTRTGDTPAGGEYLGNLTRFDWVCLWDYLDKDNVPVSLGIPSVEKVPMVCAISPRMMMQVSPKKQTDISPPQKQGEYIVHEDGYFLNLKAAALRASQLSTTFCYPFKRSDGSAAQSYTADGVAYMFFSKDTIGFRGLKNVHPDSDSDFTGEGSYNEGIFRIPLQSQTLSFNNVTDENQAVDLKNLTFSGAGGLSAVLEGRPAFTVKYRKKTDQDGNEAGEEEYIGAHCNIVPVDATGKALDDYKDDAKFLKLINAGNSDAFSCYLTFYVRVKCNGKTVDLVPATGKDDKLNNIDFGLPEQLMSRYTGSAGPALKFATDLKVSYNLAAFESMAGSGQKKVLTEGIFCPDPRYNHAPENWLDAQGIVNDKTAWLTKVKNEYLGKDGRDSDIWMFCSNQEYLQSIYELAMLPRISNLAREGDQVQGNCGQPDRDRTEYATEIGQLAHGNLMWKTYRCYPTVGATPERDDFEGMGIDNLSAAYKVNPYAQSLDSLMAAFANTPYDWAMASTNNLNISDSDLKAVNFNKKYAFSAMNNNAKIDWEDLEDIAGTFQSNAQARALNGGSWEDAWDNLGWGEEEFCGLPADADISKSLSGVDRKYLYGFWRDSFANRQQLFLIFLRAEPTMMGGGSIGQTPPQLGARAVALVWRNPETGTAGQPHRMRVLFYRQFD